MTSSRSDGASAFQSTLPARGATIGLYYNVSLDPISIHAPRTGSDERLLAQKATSGHFNPRSPHGERRRFGGSFAQPRDFNPRSPHGERRQRGIMRLAKQDFNPRSPHGERQRQRQHIQRQRRFQSTLPARGATVKVSFAQPNKRISIHAPRTGSDGLCTAVKPSRSDFNPRSPHGERLATQSRTSCDCRFQSTLPARGATGDIGRSEKGFAYFNPRSPHGERQGFKFRGIDDVIFQSTLPARGATTCKRSCGRFCAFQSTLPARGATYSAVTLLSRC